MQEQTTLSLDTMLTCRQITDLIIDYVTEEMDQMTLMAFEAHLRLCKDCDAFLKTYCQIIRATHALRYEDIPVEMIDRVQQFLRKKLESIPEHQ
jgi:hypothetical protein